MADRKAAAAQWVPMVRIVDQRGVASDQHQVVRGRRAGYVGEVVVAQRELLRVGKVRRDIPTRVLFVNSLVSALEPCLVVVPWRHAWRIRAGG